MKIMGYPNFGRVKTIVLPSLSEDESSITLEQYKERFGIDLKSHIELYEQEGEKYIRLNFGDNAILYTNSSNKKSLNGILPLNFVKISRTEDLIILIIAWKSIDEESYDGFSIDVPIKSFNLESVILSPFAV